MKYAEFQSLYGRSDPRSVLAFQQPHAEVLPHIVVQAEELSAPLVLYDTTFTTAASSASASSSPPPPPSSGKESFLVVFSRCFDGGEWLVVKDASQVDYADWRQVAVRLASVLPDARFRMRGHFRLFVFVLEHHELSHIVPPLLQQFAIVVDAFGNAHTRTQVAPIFGGSSAVSVAGGADFVALAPTVQEAPGERENDRARPYLAFADARSRALDFNAERTAATDPEYVDEVLCSLREELLQAQASRAGGELTAEIERQLEAALEAMRSAQQRQCEGSFEPPDKPLQDPAAERERVTAEVSRQFRENYDWIYERILEWVVEQCPDADISALPAIDAAEIAVDGLIWQTQEEKCQPAVWNGTPVAVKAVRPSLVADVNEALHRAFANEAARHFQLRHPCIVSVFGLSDGLIVLESCTGTLEQALIRARYDDSRWTVRHFFLAAQQVLQGLVYLATHVVHRDIACRSVIETRPGFFKIGQFGCAVPLQHSPWEAKAGKIPVRWTAPEGFAGDFSPASDVYSFGVMMWEAVQYAAALPFGDEREAARCIVQKQRLTRPRVCCAALFEMLISPATAAEPTERPTAMHLLSIVSHALASWPPEQLEQVIPFPVDGVSFEEYNRVAAT